MRIVSDRISYLPAASQPLSADVGFIRGDRYEWIFDLGSSDEAAAAIKAIGREKNVILSHFHQDHTGNLSRISCASVYCGSYTKKKLGTGLEVTASMTFEDGIKLTVFPLPSTHCKGAVGLEVNEEYAFLGDAVYGTEKNGRTAFNITLLKDMLLILGGLKAEKFLLSHDAAFVTPKAHVLAELTQLYQMRTPGEPYVFL